MKKLPLLPHHFQLAGYLLLLPFLALGTAYLGWDFELSWLAYTQKDSTSLLGNNNLTDEIAMAGCIISLMLIAFSKEKTEDEAVQFFRLASLQWAVIVSYLVTLLIILFVYGTGFVAFLVYNIYTTLVIFIIRFRFVWFQHNRIAI